MSSLFISTVQRILSIGRGPKVLLLDTKSSQIISNLIPHSKFLDHDFFLFERIESKNRSKMEGTTCVCFLRVESMNLLLLELKNPYYSDYIILFANKVPDDLISIIAEADVSSSVRGLYEVYIDLIQQEMNLFTVFGKNENMGDDVLSLQYIGRVCDGLYSLYKTLDYVPIIRVQGNSDAAKFIGTELSSRYSGDDLAGGTLLVIDRKVDLVSVLLYSWSFQAMISEYCEYDSRHVSINGENYSLDNEFFDSLKFLDINSASIEIKKYSTEKTEKISRGLIKNITNTSKRNEISETVLTVYNKIIKECMVNKDISELEYEIIQNKKTDFSQLSMIKNGDIPYLKRLKLLIIYLLKTKFNFAELESGRLTVSEVVLKYSEFRADLLKFKRIYMDDNYELSQKKFKFRKDLDLKLGYEPYLKTIIQSVFNGDLDISKFPFVRGKDLGVKNLIVYMVGGLTYNEYKIASEYIEEHNKKHDHKLVLVTDKIISYNDIMGKISNKTIEEYIINKN